jgi:hypothetical protein
VTEEEKITTPTLSSKIKKWQQIIQFSLNQRKIAGKAMKWLGRLLGKFIRVVRIERLSLYLRAGFDDPAFTGSLHGFYTGIMHGLDIGQYKHIKLDFEPLFNDEDIIEFEGSVSIRTSLARLLWPVVVALFTFPYVSAVILWLRIRKMRRRLE